MNTTEASLLAATKAAGRAAREALEATLAHVDAKEAAQIAALRAKRWPTSLKLERQARLLYRKASKAAGRLRAAERAEALAKEAAETAFGYACWKACR